MTETVSAEVKRTTFRDKYFNALLFLTRSRFMLFFERYSLVLDALLIAPNLALKSNDLLLGFFGISFSSFG